MSNNLNTALSSTFEAVSATATTITSTVNTVSTTVHMLNDLVTDQRRKQLQRIAVSNVGYKQKLLDQAMLDMAQSQEETKNWVGTDQERINIWTAVSKEFEGVFDHIED